jgi:hypothetical protein
MKMVIEIAANKHAFAFDFFVFLSLWPLIWVMVGLFGNGGTSLSSSIASQIFKASK